MHYILTLLTVKVYSQNINEKLPHRQIEESKYSPQFFLTFQKKINTAIPSLGSFAVWQKEGLVYEHYFHGASDTTQFNIKSITKSITSAIGGIVRDKGLLPDLNTPVVNILTEYAPPALYPHNVWYAEDRLWHDSLRRVMTLKDILTMQTGLAWNDFGATVNGLLFSTDPVRYTLEVPYDEEPGQTFNYCSGASTVFEAVLERLIKTDLKLFADTNLFNPIGIKNKRWDTDPMGRYSGASEMFLTTQELMRFGLLYLHRGNSNGQQIIAESWIKESWAAHAKLNKWPVLPHANGYGYYWWRRKTNGYQAYIASGAGGQLICIIPKLDIVIVTNCFMNDKNRGRMEIKLLHLFIDQVVKEMITKH
ncbi:MAG: serine hydrolase [Ferruginibacter sp.]|nr:serine hydrolase [Ferruginibacter sp.]